MYVIYLKVHLPFFSFHSMLKISSKILTSCSCWHNQLFILALETTKYYWKGGEMIGANRERSSPFLFVLAFVCGTCGNCVSKSLSITAKLHQNRLSVGNVRRRCSSHCILGPSLWFSHWTAKTPAGLFGLRQAPAALRRKTALESPVAWFIHIPLVKAKSGDCTVCHEIPCLGGFSQCYGFLPTWPNLKESGMLMKCYECVEIGFKI